ncbi:hypothetical protein EDD18DRAFT_1311183 [Armillaria luteobubalina]|uniref:RNase H type-1 domain-containing protein n=1 Tax=Armillaria luteobubalina TaxID=153913 RepID=A0AA39PVC6_9AGAR|nr:hypothetical protein EDD18DRAFT_1311183 [Armillaria luteobubalina]
MLHVAKDLNVRLDMLVPSQEVWRQIPLWYHIGFKTKTGRRYGLKAYKCLMTNHGVETAGEAADVEQRLDSPNHTKQQNSAKLTLNELVEKWDPCRLDSNDGLELTADDQAANQVAKEQDGRIRFNPDLGNKDPLTDGIWIFTSGWDTHPKPGDDEGIIAISIAYTDGSSYENGTAEACVGAGVWFGEADDRNIFLRLPGPNQTNNAAEI